MKKKILFKIKNKGFTLIELLAVIAVLALILVIVLYGYSSHIKNSKKKLSKVEIEQLINAGSIYYSEFKNDDSYNYYIKDDGTMYSCISVKSLIDTGYYKNNLSFLDENLTKDNAVIKVEEKDGIINYELNTDYNKDSDCIYYDLTSGLDNNTEISINNNDNVNNKISLNTNITNNPNEKNSYLLKLKFNASIYEKVNNYKGPLYVLELIDESGSMARYGKYDKAKDASITLSENLINLFDESYIELVNFSDHAAVSKPFSHEAFTTNNFVPGAQSGQYTNVLEALDLAYDEMEKIDDNSPRIIKYIILLTDGRPALNQNKTYDDMTCKSYTKACKQALKEKSDKIKEANINFVIFGYRYADNEEDNYKNVYKQIASQDTTGTICPDSSYENYCYYDSDTDNLVNLFNKLSNNIEENVNAQTISESIINIKVDKSIKLFDSDGNQIENLEIDIPLNDDANNIIDKEYEYIIHINDLDDDDFTCDYNKEECTYTQNVFQNDGYYISLYDMNKTYVGKLEPDDSPSITITKNLKSYIN